MLSFSRVSKVARLEAKPSFLYQSLSLGKLFHVAIQRGASPTLFPSLAGPELDAEDKAMKDQ